MLCAKLELQILKVGRFSIGWFMLAARLVRAHLPTFVHKVDVFGTQCSMHFHYITLYLYVADCVSKIVQLL